MIEFLDPARLQVEVAPNGTLRAIIEGERCGRNVVVLRAFPLSAPQEHIVLRDGAGKELGVLESLRVVDERTRAILQAALDRQYFLPRILKINSLYERFGSAVWEVETDRGPIKISSSNIIDALSEMGGGRYLLRDSEGNRYEIRDIENMDEASQLRFAGKA